MKRFMFLFILLTCTFCYSEGFIKDENIAVLDSCYSEECFLPTRVEVVKSLSACEKYLYLNKENDDEIQKILNHKDDYCVQIVGIIKSNERVLFLNFLDKEFQKDESFYKNIIFIEDGGFYFWNIEYNTGKDECTSISINGEA